MRTTHDKITFALVGLLAVSLAACGDDDGVAAPAAETVAGPILLGTGELTAGIPGDGPLTSGEIREWLANPVNHEPLEVRLPLGLSTGQSSIKGLDANPLTRAKIELGRQLYFDTRLSADGSVSCATCHDPDHGYAAGTQFGVGIVGQTGNRNSPTAYNRILSDLQFWDGRAATLEAQAVGPIENPIEMGNTHATCVGTLTDIEGYVLQFDRIFGGVTIDAVGQALASFERVIVTGPAPFDYHEDAARYADLDADELAEDPEFAADAERALAAAAASPMSASAIRGRNLFFGRANCSACHVGANLTDETYRNLGVGMDAAEPDLGRYEETKEDKHRGAFKTPTIRNVAQTPPYMHDGSQKTLEEVVEWYAQGGHANAWLDEKIVKLDLTARDKVDLVEFMRACTGDLPPVERGRLPAGGPVGGH